ncbi:NAD-dependent succinate-semialdehyde dehydrogenase [Neobacillus sp. FSL H8-0543]|uniref:NAD-dependent succinate-semialdehyde dehydrogenase n=1 Tax=Neobacillus sp. FSL H8-0543 TaxID=2954672 RepID=UPI0031594580
MSSFSKEVREKRMEATKLNRLNYMWINGEKVEGNETMDVINPATGKVIGIVPRATKEQTLWALQSAESAFKGWAKLPAESRAAYLMQWADSLLLHQKKLAEIIVEEQGKPINEALGEIFGSALIIRWYAEEGKRAYGEILPASNIDQKLMVMKQPVGVVGLITPTNMPAGTVIRKTAAALAAGCTFVLKPAPETPRTSVALIQYLMETGIPAGVANLVIGDEDVVGKVLIEDARVRKISFTGSTAVGKQIMQEAASTMKRLSLELGGNCPAIVFPDADVDKAVEAIFNNKFENSGQVCNGINRIYVHESIEAEFSEKFTEKVNQLKVGNGFDPDVQIGPLVAKSYLDKVERLVEDAHASGAKVLAGGRRLTEGDFSEGNFYAPTVLTNLTEEMSIIKEEIFGPVAPILTFENELEVVAKSNDTSYGLAAYFFSQDISRIYRLIDGLEAGGIGVNGTSLAYVQSPFGGVKESGIGKEGGHHGLTEYLELKYVALSY